MEPPAYTEEPIEGSSTIPQRSIQDTRALILGNAEILRPRRREGNVELIVAKTTGPRASAEDVAVEQHYAFVVIRKINETDIHILIKGEPKDSIEEALAWMLDRTEVAMKDVLGRHGRHADTGCCVECGRAMRPGVSPFRTLGWPTA